MKHSGLKNEEKVSELLISGSLAIKTKNLSGVHLFEEKNKDYKKQARTGGKNQIQ